MMLIKLTLSLMKIGFENYTSKRRVEKSNPPRTVERTAGSDVC
jgi:hypothetical protein